MKQVRMTNYKEIEDASVYGVRRTTTIGNIWLFEGSTWYLEWKDQHLRRVGNSVYWHPYITSKEVKPIRLYKPKGWGKDDWAINKEY